MKSAPFLTLLTAGALLLTGCGASAGETASGSSTSADPAETATADPVAQTEMVPLLDSCIDLFGGEHPVLNEASQFLTDVKSLDAASAEEAAEHEARLQAVIDEAEADLAAPLFTIQWAFFEFGQAHEFGDDWSLDAAAYADAQDQVKEICGAELDAAGSEFTPIPSAPEPELTPEAAFLAEVRAAHPNLESTPDADIIDPATAFCTVHSKEGGEAVAEQLLVAAIGIKFTEAELRTIQQAGLTSLCPEHAG